MSTPAPLPFHRRVRGRSARRILDRTDGDILGFPARGRRDPPNGPPAGTAGRRAAIGSSCRSTAICRPRSRTWCSHRPTGPQGRAGDECGGDVDHHRGNHRSGRYGSCPIAGLRSARRHGPPATGPHLPGPRPISGPVAGTDAARASVAAWPSNAWRPALPQEEPEIRRLDLAGPDAPIAGLGRER